MKGMRLWDLATYQPLSEYFGPPALPGTSVHLAFGGLNDSLLAEGDSSGNLAVWQVSLPAWRERACALAGRSLTGPEWQQFLGGDEPYHATCPDFA